jgi:hypothetical protein
MKTNQFNTLIIKPAISITFALLLTFLAGCNTAAPLPPTATPVPATATPVPPTPTLTPTDTPVPPTPTITETPITPETILLSTRTNEVKSKMILVDGHKYTIRISGTFSNWDGAYWAQYGVCDGTPDAAPAYPIAGVAKSPVGQDAFYWYAYPKGPGSVGLCGKITPPTPATILKYSVEGGSNSFSYSPAPEYNTSHTYTITLIGKNFPLTVDLNDTDYLDNQGTLKIEIIS